MLFLICELKDSFNVRVNYQNNEYTLNIKSKDGQRENKSGIRFEKKCLICILTLYLI